LPNECESPTDGRGGFNLLLIWVKGGTGFNLPLTWD
jgi:hypothetical protein